MERKLSQSSRVSYSHEKRKAVVKLDKKMMQTLLEEEQMLAEEEYLRERYQKFLNHFDRLDDEGTGKLDVVAVRKIFKETRFRPSAAHLYVLSQELEASVDGKIDQWQFLQIFREDRQALYKDQDTVDAFVALGGNHDKSGFVDGERLKKVVQDFGLSIDIQELLELFDDDGSGELEYDEFVGILGDDSTTDQQTSPTSVPNPTAPMLSTGSRNSRPHKLRTAPILPSTAPITE